MNTNIIKKIILVLVVATLLTIGLTGCGGGIIIISTTGTVVVTVDGPGTYDIYMDTVYKGTIDAHGQLKITNVPAGSYYFEADGDSYGWFDSWWDWNFYKGSTYQTTDNGRINYVTIPVRLYSY